MALILMRHGHASPGPSGEKELSKIGLKQVENTAYQLFEAGYEVQLIMHSGKLRASQTAAILAARIGHSAIVQHVAGLLPTDDVTEIAIEINRATVSVAIIGHMPHISNLLFHLTGVQDTPAFETAAATTLTKGEFDWEIDEEFHPKLL